MHEYFFSHTANSATLKFEATGQPDSVDVLLDDVRVVPYFKSTTYEVFYCFDPLPTCELLNTDVYPDQWFVSSLVTYECLATATSLGLQAKFCSRRD